MNIKQILKLENKLNISLVYILYHPEKCLMCFGVSWSKSHQNNDVLIFSHYVYENMKTTFKKIVYFHQKCGQ